MRSSRTSSAPLGSSAALLIGLLLAGTAAPALAAPNQLREVVVDVQAEGEPVRDVLRRLEREHGLNYVVSEAALAEAGAVTVRFKQVPLDFALEAICSAAGLSMEVRGPILVILPKPADARPRLPEVDEGILPPGAAAKRFVPERPPAPAAGPAEPRRATGSTGAPARSPASRSSEGQGDAMAVGDVLEVDLPNRRLQLRVDGLKRDFYLPPAEEVGPQNQTARLARALATLEQGNRVALLYRNEAPGRAEITNLIGGGKVTEPEAAFQPRRPVARRGGERPPPAPASARTAPEAEQLPEGVLAGRFAGREGEEVKVVRGDGEVVTCLLPSAEDAERREKVIEVVDGLAKDARVFLTYEVIDGKLWIRDTGLTESR